MAAGRPREFDMDEALDQALHVFWKKGYEGASMPDLTAAMGINRPSIYGAFGNKEELFRKALDRYMQKSAVFTEETLNEPTARASIERFLRGVIDKSVCPDSPRGCLLVQGALVCGEESETVRRELISCRARSEERLQKRFERAKQEGDLKADSNPAQMARFYSAVLQGMAVQTASGAGREELEQIVEMALAAWPE